MTHEKASGTSLQVLFDHNAESEARAGAIESRIERVNESGTCKTYQRTQTLGI
jgi:hypothetical protein